MGPNAGARFATGRRRSRRLPLAVPLFVSSQDPTKEFSENCETIWINAHGCSLRSPKPLHPGDIVRLDVLHSDRKTQARVVHAEAIGNAWEIGLELDKAENFWGVNFPPEDWVSAVSEAPAAAATASDAPASPTSAPLPPQPELASNQGVQLAQLEGAIQQEVASLVTQSEQSQYEVLGRLVNDLRTELYATMKREYERTLAGAERIAERIAADIQARLSHELTHRLESVVSVLEEVRQTKTYLESLVSVVSEQMEAQRQQWASLQGSSTVSSHGTREVAEAELRAVGSQWLEEMRQELASEYAERRMELYEGLETQLNEVRTQLANQLQRAQQISAHLENFSQNFLANLEKQLTHGLAEVLEPARAQLDAQLRETQLARLRAVEERIEEHNRKLTACIEQAIATLDQREQALSASLNERVRSQEKGLLDGSARLVVQAQELTAKLEQRQQAIVTELEAHLEEVRRSVTHMEQLAQTAEATLRDHLAQFVAQALERARQDLRHHVQQVFDEQVRTVEESWREHSNRWQAHAENVLASLEQRIQQANEVAAQLQLCAPELASQADEAVRSLAAQMQRFESSIHDTLIDATGQMKGRIQVALENAQASLEERTQIAQKHLEETSGRVVQILQELSAGLEGRLRAAEAEVAQRLNDSCQQSLTSALDLLESKTRELTEQASRGLQAKIDDLLDSIARVLREKLTQA